MLRNLGRTVKVVHVRVEAAAILHARVEPILAEGLEAGPSEVEPTGHHLHVPLPHCVVHHILVLLNLRTPLVQGSAGNE